MKQYVYQLACRDVHNTLDRKAGFRDGNEICCLFLIKILRVHINNIGREINRYT